MFISSWALYGPSGMLSFHLPPLFGAGQKFIGIEVSRRKFMGVVVIPVAPVSEEQGDFHLNRHVCFNFNSISRRHVHIKISSHRNLKSYTEEFHINTLFLRNSEGSFGFISNSSGSVFFKHGMNQRKPDINPSKGALL